MLNFGFKTRLNVVVLVILSLALVVSSTLSYQSKKKIIDDNVDLLGNSTLSYESNGMNSWLQHHLNGLLTARDRLGELKSYKDSEQLLLLLNHSLNFMNVAYASDGNPTIVSSNGVVKHYVKSEFDPRTRPWYRGAIESNDIYITDIYEDSETKKKVISLSVAVRQAGKPMGVLLGDLSLDSMIAMVEQVEFHGGQALLLDTELKVLASYNQQQIGATLVDYAPELRPLHNAMRSQTRGQISYSLGGIAKVGFFNRITVNPQTSFTLLVLAEEDKLYSALREETSRTIMFAIGAILFGGLAMYLVMRQIYQPILRLKAIVQDLASGDADLTQRLPVRGQDDLAVIAGSINTFIGNLQQLVKEIDAASKQIDAGLNQAESVAQSNRDVLFNHQSETEQVASAVTEMSSTADAVAQGAVEGAELAQQLTGLANQSYQVISQTSTDMTGLAGELNNAAEQSESMNQEAQQITRVLDVIQAVSEQTNLLALNAAIEAARAGEAGRGFAVVADEVRALAARTQESTQEIGDMLQSLNNGSGRVVEMMDSTKERFTTTVATTEQALDAIGNINSHISGLEDSNSGIATAAEQQRAVTEEVSVNVNRIKEIAEQLTASGEQVLAATEQVSASNVYLNGLLTRFKV